MTVNVGTLSVQGGRGVLVSDPSYVGETAERLRRVGQGIADVRIPDGDYPVYVTLADTGELGERVSRLEMGRCDAPVIAEHVVYVDSGQMAFFDAGRLDQYDADSGFEPGRSSEVPSYQSVCDMTIERDGGVIGGMVAASRSGYGDGAYVCRVFGIRRPVGIAVYFITEELYADVVDVMCRECGAPLDELTKDEFYCDSCGNHAWVEKDQLDER